VGPDRARQGALLSNATLRTITAAFAEKRS
jgi:hypothetical protein